jgi:putative addiction module component (TIGR02574 family)
MPTSPLETIASEALKLSPDERADLADRLWISVQDGDTAADVDEAWEVEIAHRIQQIDGGEVQCRPWREVMSELRAKHG